MWLSDLTSLPLRALLLHRRESAGASQHVTQNSMLLCCSFVSVVVCVSFVCMCVCVFAVLGLPLRLATPVLGCWVAGSKKLHWRPAPISCRTLTCLSMTVKVSLALADGVGLDHMHLTQLWML